MEILVFQYIYNCQVKRDCYFIELMKLFMPLYVCLKVYLKLLH